MHANLPPTWLRSLPDGRTISALGFGCASLWAGKNFPTATAMQVLDALEEEGVTHFDTGPSYGAGLGEGRLGQWLAGKDRSRFIVATKVGTNLIDGEIIKSFDPGVMERSLLGSLDRLGIEQVDFLYLHGPDKATLNPGVFDFFDRMKADGRIVWSGVNTFDPDVLDAVINTPIDAVMLQYNIGDRRNADQMAALHADGKIVMSGTALSRARFSWRSYIPTSRNGLWYALRLLKDDPLAPIRGRRLAQTMRRADQPLARTAVQFMIGRSMLTSSLFGTTSVDHARENARAGHQTLPPEIDRMLTAMIP